ncbi:MAG: STAS domain-containing protein [Candidatus Cloacimonetes bacterium]|nr:STAS domain-containing protein [Candidatus Cloacimonadota bacterium]
MIDISFNLADDIGIVKISGELDASNSKDLRKAFDDYFNRTSIFILDFSDLQFMDSTGLGTIIRIFKHAELKQGYLCIANPRNKAARVLHMTQAHKVINIFDTIDEALQSIKSN